MTEQNCTTYDDKKSDMFVFGSTQEFGVGEVSAIQEGDSYSAKDYDFVRSKHSWISDDLSILRSNFFSLCNTQYLGLAPVLPHFFMANDIGTFLQRFLLQRLALLCDTEAMYDSDYKCKEGDP